MVFKFKYLNTSQHCQRYLPTWRPESSRKQAVR